MRLIDADTIKYHKSTIMTGFGLYDYKLVDQVYKETIDEMHTIDAVEVVRCKDCKHYEQPYCMLCRTRISTGYHSRDMAYRKADDYCSYGKRKETNK